MKKYVKPELIYEEYELSRQIANCVWELKSIRTEVCGAVLEGVDEENAAYQTLFHQAPLCSFINDDVEAYCYQNSVGDYPLHAS